jgi:hypothetical protein
MGLLSHVVRAHSFGASTNFVCSLDRLPVPQEVAGSGAVSPANSICLLLRAESSFYCVERRPPTLAFKE